MLLDGLTAFGHDGIHDCCSATGADKDAGFSVLDFVSPAVHEASPPTEVGDKSILHVSTSAMAGSCSNESGSQHREGVHGCFPKGVRGFVQCHGSERSLDDGTAPAPHQPLRHAISVFSSKAFLPGQSITFRSGQTTQQWLLI